MLFIDTSWSCYNGIKLGTLHLVLYSSLCSSTSFKCPNAYSVLVISGESVDDTEYEKDIEINPDEMDIPAINQEQMLVQILTGSFKCQTYKSK